MFLAVRYSRPDGSRRWTALLAGAVATTIPGLYQWSLTPGFDLGFWGMVDSFLGALAALAVALCLAGWRLRRRWPGVVALFLAAFSIYVKPAGMFVFAFCALHFLATRWMAEGGGTNGLKRLWIDAALAVLAGTMLLPAWFSPYLSSEHLVLGKTSMAILRADFLTAADWTWIRNTVYYVLGTVPALWLTAFGLITPAVRAFHGNAGRSQTALLWLAVIAWLSAGMGFLVLGTDPSQVRYGFPFFFSAFVCAAVLGVEAFEAAARPVRIAADGLLTAHLVAFIALLVAPRHSGWTHSLAGWRMQTSLCQAELRDGRQWLHALSLKKPRRIVQIYNVGDTVPAHTVASLILYNNMVGDPPSAAPVYVNLESPRNWSRKSGIYLAEIDRAEYLLADALPAPLPIPAKNADVLKKAAYLAGRLKFAPPAESGCSPRQLGTSVTLLEVVNRARFKSFIREQGAELLD